MESRPTVAVIDLSAIRHNLAAIKKKVAPAKVMAVVKANAYGHGMVRVAETALSCGAAWLGVATLEEGIRLREHGVSAPILVFGGFFEQQVHAYLRHGLTATVYDAHRARLLSDAAREKKCTAVAHLKVDTGMGRVGVDWRSASKLAAEIAELDHLNLEGVYSHFASSDEKDKSQARQQLQRFEQAVAEIEASGVRLAIRHMANSGAILELDTACFDLVRAGVMMYGYYPSAETSESVELRPAMTLKSKVIAVKTVEARATISYGATYQTSQRTHIVTVPVGYGDGYNRLLSNRAEVLIHGRRFPVVGRVCMDQIMVDVGAETKIVAGDEVVLMGRQQEQEISIYEFCEKMNTIPYEVTCLITSRVPREFIQ